MVWYAAGDRPAEQRRSPVDPFALMVRPAAFWEFAIKLDLHSLLLAAGGTTALIVSAAFAQAPRLHQPASAQPRATGAPGGPTDGPGWSDSFDAYANGAQLIGLGGFVGWPGYPADNPTALASNAFAASPLNSCRFALANPGGSPATDQTDMIRAFAITGGHWAFRVKTYMPSTAISTGAKAAPYIMLLSGYPAFAWSVQVHFEKDLGRVLADRVGGPGGVGGGLSDPAVPLVLGQWVELVIDFDLDAAPNGTYSVTYGGVPVITGGDWNAGSSPPFMLQAVNFYDSSTSEFYVDDASISTAPVPTPCYANCDSSPAAPCLNVLDFACFLNSFSNGSTYANCDNSTIAPVLNVLDFACFINRFSAGCSSC